MNATLIAANLPQFFATTNHYSTSDGRYLIVTIPTFNAAELAAAALEPLETATGIRVPILVSHLPKQADVYLADENATILDANGDPADGMTPLVVVPDCDTFTAALEAAGYDLLD